MKPLSKLGQGTGKLWIALAYLGLVVFIGLTIMYNLKSIAEGTSFTQDYLSKDIALLLETLSSAPGTVAYQYPVNPSFSYSISEGQVSIKKDTIQSYPFTQDLSISLSARTAGNAILFQKTA